MKLTLKQMQEEVERIADQGVRSDNVVALQPIWNRSGKGNYEDGRDFCDQDYPGPGLEDLFWDIPNM